MLPAAHRLRRRAEFVAAARRGRRAARRTVAVSILDSPGNGDPTRIGFVVGRQVGGAVVRNRVRRRLRALVAARLDQLPPGSRVVVRALPGAQEVTYAQLAEELDSVLTRGAR